VPYSLQIPALAGICFYMPSLPISISSFLLLSLSFGQAFAQPYQHLRGQAQGTTYQISYQPRPRALPPPAFDSIFQAIDLSLSLYNPASLISAFNRSRLGIHADTHLLHIAQAALHFSESSQGAFDITILPAMDAWGFGQTPVQRLPTAKALQILSSHIGYKHLTIRNDSLLKDIPQVQIDCNGIAQGYTVDLIAQRLEQAGITDYLVELGGEIRLKGKNPQGKPWNIGIEAPPGIASKAHSWTVAPSNGAITSSGIYRNIRRIQGREIGHILDPRSAQPANSQVVSVTAIAPTAMTADAIDHTCHVLGVEASLQWVSHMKGVAIMLVYRDGQGKLRDTASLGFPAWKYP